MEPLTVGIISIVVLIALILIGMHIGLAFLLVGFCGTLLITGSFEGSVSLLLSTSFFASQEWGFITLPLFVIMGSFGEFAGITAKAFRVAHNWIGRLPGGLSIATIIACSFFGGITGSSIVEASVFTKLAYPEMLKLGYDKKLASGSIASASVLANLIPPSAMAIIFAMLTKTSIAALFIGGVLPGIILAILYSMTVYGRVISNPKLAPRSSDVIPWRQKVVSLKDAWGGYVLITLVIGGIYGGIFTPSEAAAAGAFAALLLVLLTKKLNLKLFLESVLSATSLCAVVFLIIIGSLLYSRFLAITGVTTTLIEIMRNWKLPLPLIVAGFVVLLLFLGCFMESVSQMTLTLPIIFPLLKSMGADPVWLGVIVVAAAETGGLTPPVGLLVSSVKAAAGDSVTLEEAFVGTFPFYPAIVVLLGLIIAFPEIVLLLPNMMITR